MEEKDDKRLPEHEEDKILEGISLEEARKIANELRTENDRRSLLLEREEKLLAQRLLGGRSEAGIEIKPKSPDEKIVEECKQMLEGTGLDPFKDE